MAQTDPNPVGRLRAAVLADASKQAADITAQAAAESVAILDRASRATDRNRAADLADARTNAARARDNLLATVPIAVERHRAARIEGLLDSIRDAARGRLLNPASTGRIEGLGALVSEALRAMEGSRFTIRLSPADRRLGDTLAEAIRGRLAPRGLELSLVEDPAVGDGGAIIASDDGRQVWDNRLVARLGRLWPDLRRQIVEQCLQPGRGGA